MTIVDVHCHTFNADDLPVRGFVNLVAGGQVALAQVLAEAFDKILQGMAQNADQELAVLDELLAGDPQPGFAVDLASVVEEEANRLFEDITHEDSALVAAAEAEIRAEEPAEQAIREIADFFGLERYLRWAALFGKPRLLLTRALAQTYPEVDLFTPMLVDLLGLEDAAESTVDQQLEINDKISQLSMRGDIGAAVHPFVGFDPRRPDAFELARGAVEHRGCIGVKLYPPMGFLPIGNTDLPPLGMTREQGKVADSALRELFGWCQDQDVPITAHSNSTNYAHRSFKHFSSPANWQRVLAEWPDLRLNFGHFGWAGLGDGWPRSICQLADSYPHVYADIGNHKLTALDRTFAELATLFADTSTDTRAMKQRFMFGTDWYMVCGHRDYEQFLAQMQAKYAATFPDGLEHFMGKAALSFLGFDDPTNRNAQRLRARYERDKYPVPAWLAT